MGASSPRSGPPSAERPRRNAIQEIAAQLSIGEDTAKRHVSDMLSKLHANEPHPRSNDWTEARNY